MTGRIDIWTGGWWRYTKYEVRGEHIAPASDATLECYDPWDQYHRSQVDSGVPAPYQTLLKLAADLQDSRNEPDKAVRLILDWCSRFGLLGILPHTAIRIDLPVRYLADVSSFNPVIRTHTRTGGRWISNKRRGVIPGAMLDEGELGQAVWKLNTLSRSVAQSGAQGTDVRQTLSQLMNISLHEHELLRKAAKNRADLVLGDLVPKGDPNDYRDPTVAFDSQVQVWADTTTEVDPLPVTSILGLYFPEFSGDGEEFECPLPLSLDFWRQYREAVPEFYIYALGFFHAAGGLNSKPSLGDLEAFIKPAGVYLSQGPDDRIEERWLCPSLLSLFGRMLIQDISAGKRILRCDCCGSPFVTDSYQGRYCSERCGFRLRQRRSRAKAASSAKDQNGKETRKQ